MSLDRSLPGIVAGRQDVSAKAGRFTLVADIHDFDSVSLPVERAGHAIRAAMPTGLTLLLSGFPACPRRLEA